MIGFDAFLAVFLAVVVLVIKPGPYVLSVASLVSTGHWKKVVSFLAGAYTAGTINYFLLLVGFTYIVSLNLGFIYFLFKTLAAVMLIYLGIKGLIQEVASSDEIEEAEETFTHRSFIENAGAGFLLTLSNPYNFLFILGVIPTVTELSSFTLSDILAIRSVVILADLCALSLYIAPLLVLKQMVEGDVLNIIKQISSFLMIAIGLYIGYTALMADDLVSSGIMG